MPRTFFDFFPYLRTQHSEPLQFPFIHVQNIIDHQRSLSQIHPAILGSPKSIEPSVTISAIYQLCHSGLASIRSIEGAPQNNKKDEIHNLKRKLVQWGKDNDVFYVDYIEDPSTVGDGRVDKGGKIKPQDGDEEIDPTGGVELILPSPVVEDRLTPAKSVEMRLRMN